ncbi:MAG: hypothetical protein KAT68_01095 [Bacteroidales bacterium]|nr:hypothetical protein [Bacteroidales bacterium]
MENFEFKKHKKCTDKRISFGIILITLGTVFILNNFGIIPYEYKDIIFTWQMLLIFIGTVGLLTRENKVGGIILIAIGAFFLLPDIFDLPHSFNRMFWPVILIFIGLIIIFRRGTHKFGHFTRKTVENSSDYIDDMSIFGGGEKKIVSNNFKGGKITSVFGGSELDFSSCTLAEGNNEIDVFMVFGGSKLILPADWRIRLDVVSIFGGFSDKRKSVPEKPENNNKELIIKGLAIFGGGEIKSY